MQGALVALMVAAAMHADHGASNGDLDWDTYLRGTWAFLVKDKPTLDAAMAMVTSEPGHGNHINGAVLRGLSTCFEKSYADAYVSCRPKENP